MWRPKITVSLQNIVKLRNTVFVREYVNRVRIAYEIDPLTVVEVPGWFPFHRSAHFLPVM